MANTFFETLKTYNRDLVDGDDVPSDLEVRKARALIVARLGKRPHVSVHRLYQDATQPTDAALYAAIRGLLADGLIKGPSIEGCRSHKQMRYTRAGALSDV